MTELRDNSRLDRAREALDRRAWAESYTLLVELDCAARIGALAEGDEILVSRETAEAVGDGFSLTERGRASLKGISEPVEVVTVEWR